MSPTKSLQPTLATYVVAGLVLLLLTACGPGTPDPAEVARLAAQAVAATLTAQPPVQAATVAPPTAAPTAAPSLQPTSEPTDVPTAVPTAAPTLTPTPAPTNTSEPTAVPTSTPRPPSAPEGWRFYQLISGEAMLAYPSQWEVTSEAEESVKWRLNKLSVLTLQDATEYTEVRTGADTETQVRELKKLILDLDLEFDNFTFPEAGVLSLPGNPAYVLVRARLSDVTITGWATLVTSPDRALLLDAFYVDRETLPEGAVDTLVRLADTVRFKPYLMPTPAPTSTPDAAPTVTKAGNLRAGPGTNYAVVGSAKVGEKLLVLGKSQDGAWLQIQSGSGEVWISTQLISKIDTSGLAVKTSSAPTVTPAPKPTQAPQAAKPQTDLSKFVQMGQEVEAGGWRFKVSEVHKRKAVYFYGSSYIAQGHFLIVIVDATNLQPGTDYFMNSVRVYLTDLPGNTYDYSWKGLTWAEWQYSKDSAFTDVNPGVSVRMAIAYDLPDSLGDVLLSSGKHLKWIYLGNFSQMQSEDQ